MAVQDQTVQMPVTTNPARAAGFTLIELLITIAIIAILASIAYPTYTEYSRRSERANAKAAMTSVAQWMERQYTANNTYPSAISGFDTNRYALTVSSAAANSFTIQAATSGSWTDPKCGTLTLTNTGTQGSSGSESSAYCWAK